MLSLLHASKLMFILSSALFSGLSTPSNPAPYSGHHVQELPPIRPDHSALFSYVNRSGLSDSQIFLQVVGINPQTGKQCFIRYQEETPIYVDVVEKVDSTEYAYPLSSFPRGEKGFTLYFPWLDGARIYTSIDQKLTFLVNQNDLGQWTINAPNPLNPDDPNRDILWDKTEFAVNPGTIFINPTAVDYFALPLHCEETGKDGSAQNGGIVESRVVVFNDIQEAFTKAGAPWTKLISTKPSLVYSPMYGAATGIFPQDYFVTSGWIDAFKAVFATTPLQIDAEESIPPKLGGGIWKGTIDRDSNVMTFHRDIDGSHPEIDPVRITLPTNADQLIGGNGPTWKLDTDLQRVFARNLSCAIDTNTLTKNTPLSMAYFKSVAKNFYAPNGEFSKELQFIDHYSQLLHSYGDHQIYTMPYDDELSQSGSASYTPQNFTSGSIILGPLK